MSIERLSFSSETGYDATELAIHLTRYSTAQRLCSGLDILDVACGEGYGAFAMASFWNAKSVKGVDVSEEAIDKARSIFPHPNIEYYSGAVENINDLFAQNSFDLVVSLETIEHVSEPEAFLAALKRVLKPNGILILSCPNDHWYYGSGESKNPFHLRTYYFDEFKDLAEKYFGAANCYLMGRPITGFGNFLQPDETDSNFYTTMKDQLLASDVVKVNRVSPDEKLSTEDCSFFVGVWGELPIVKEDLINCTFCPTSMDKFSLTLESKNKDLVSKSEALTANLENSQKWNDELQTSLKKSQSRITDLEKWTNDLQKVMNDAQNRVAELDEFIIGLQNTISQYQAQTEKLELDINKSNENLRTVRLESEKFQRELDVAQVTINLMEESRFWKMRNQWFKLKGKFLSVNSK